MSDKIPMLVGEGVLTWMRRERISDRYGTVYLMAAGNDTRHDEHGPRPALTTPPDGTLGELVAEVVATRQSTHIGDLFRGIFPRTPAVGQRITLGTGRAFTEDESVAGEGHYRLFGLEPLEARASDWLDPRALYDVHEQTVRL